jgi:hypothetical protein
MTEKPQTCQKCGSPVTPGMKFCESCGAKIEALPACPQCGAALVPDVKFCESCGAPVGPAAAPVQEKPAPETPPVPAAGAPAGPQVKPEEKTIKVPAPVKEPPKTIKVKEVPVGTGPKKPIPRLTLIIAGIVILALLGAAVYFVGLPMMSGTGTVSSPAPSGQTTVQTAAAGASATSAQAAAGTGSAEITAGPTDVLPSNRALVIDVERDDVTSLITVTFQGGAGQYGVRDLAITLTRGDGTVETKSLSHLERGSSVTLQGTTMTDRVEVTANFYNGETYKVVDKIIEYKKRVN